MVYIEIATLSLSNNTVNILSRDMSLIGKSIWKNYRSVFDDHFKYIHNDISSPYNVIIAKYTKILHEMFDIVCYFYHTIKEGDDFDNTNCMTQNKQYPEETINMAS